jgi:hypothetical protein
VSEWYRVMCDRHQPLTPVCDIERTESGIAVYPQFGVRMPELEDHTPLGDRIAARKDAERRGEPPPLFHTGVVRTANPDVAQGESYWFTCEMCRRVGPKKKRLSPRVQADLLPWILDRLGGELKVIENVEVREPVPREQWEADPSQPRYTSHRVRMRLLPLTQLQDQLAGNPRGGSNRE